MNSTRYLVFAALLLLAVFQSVLSAADTDFVGVAYYSPRAEYKADAERLFAILKEHNITVVTTESASAQINVAANQAKEARELISKSIKKEKPHITLFPFVISQETAATFYKAFKGLTAHPRLIAPLTGFLCRPPSKVELDKEQAMTGPHTRIFAHYYANPAAVDNIAANATEFPVDAVIVKEKLQGQKTVSAVAGMVKRPQGYDPANGGWEFFFYTSSGEFSTGKLANCIDCHNGAKKDHVFRTLWERPPTPTAEVPIGLSACDCGAVFWRSLTSLALG